MFLHWPVCCTNLDQIIEWDTNADTPCKAHKGWASAERWFCCSAEALKDENLIYPTPYGSNDDWYWMYATVKAGKLLALCSLYSMLLSCIAIGKVYNIHLWSSSWQPANSNHTKHISGKLYYFKYYSNFFQTLWVLPLAKGLPFIVLAWPTRMAGNVDIAI